MGVKHKKTHSKHHKIDAPHVEMADRYIDGVISGAIPACKYVQMSCERQRLDRERWAGRDEQFWFDFEAAEEICRFIERMPHVKGEWASRGESIRLEPWQCFLVTSAFGWKKEHRRRFRTVYIEVPRKNAKSTLSSGVALYMLTADNEQGAEVYSAATTYDQARIVFDGARQMAQKQVSFRVHYGVEIQTHSIVMLPSASRFQALSADSHSLDGLNVHCAVIDELHAHQTRAVYDVLETATGSRHQPLIWSITTAGSNRAGICYEVRGYLVRLLQRVFEDNTFFGAIWTIDDEDDWTDPEIWKKANPNFGVSIYPDDFERLARKAMELPSATNNFLTKRLDVWVNADTAWMDMRAWERAGDPTLKLEDFAGQPCWIGLDLASKVDIAAKITLFKRMIDGVSHYYLFGRYYLPEEAAEDGRNSQYSGWVRTGRLVTTPGNVTDYDYIKTDLREDASKFQIDEVPYDPFQATQLSVELLAEGFPMVEVRPTVLNFSEPMKELEKLILQGRLHHDGDPVLAWMASNVVAHLDHKDNIYPRHEGEANKIDGIVASIMCLRLAMLKEESAYEKGGLLIL